MAEQLEVSVNLTNQKVQFTGASRSNPSITFDYNTWLSYRKALGLAVIVFDQKNDHRKILVDSNWDTIKDQETWMEIVKANTTSDGDFRMV
jgi:hypothetical protein